MNYFPSKKHKISQLCTNKKESIVFNIFNIFDQLKSPEREKSDLFSFKSVKIYQNMLYKIIQYQHINNSPKKNPSCTSWKAPVARLKTFAT